MFGRIVAFFALVIGITAYLAPEPVLYELLQGLGVLLFLPFEIMPLDTIFTALIVSPLSLCFMLLFLLGTLFLGLVELG
jgi:hypothetical protein